MYLKIYLYISKVLKFLQNMVKNIFAKTYLCKYIFYQYIFAMFCIFLKIYFKYMNIYILKVFKNIF